MALLVAGLLWAVAAAGVEAAEIEVDFVEGDAAAELMLDETYHAYFELLKPVEMRARVREPLEAEDAEAMRAEVRQAYRDSVRDFTDAERAALRHAVAAIDAVAGERWPGMARRPWRFVKFTGVVGDLPHTRGDAIMLPQPFLAAFTRLHGQDEPSVEQMRFFLSIFVHEQAHVLQRLEQEAFNDFYKETWGFHLAETIEAPDELLDRKLTNPDGVEIGWVLPVDDEDRGETRWVWPLLVLRDMGQPRMPAHLAMITTDVEPVDEGRRVFRVVRDEAGDARSRPLATDAGYVEAVAAEHSNYHPNEIMAAFMQDTFSIWHVQAGEAGVPPAVEQQIREREREHRATVAWLDEHLGDL